MASPDPRDEYFTDAMTGGLILTLSKVASPRVIARAAIIQYPKEHELIGQSARRRE
jgi:TolB-like protein